MKIHNLYILEEAEANADAKSNGVATIVSAALKGIGRAILLLGSVIYHGLLGQAIAVGKVKPSEAVNALGTDRVKKLRDIFKKKGKDLDKLDPADQLGQAVADNVKKYKELTALMTELQELDPAAAKKASIALAEWRESDEYSKAARDKNVETALKFEASILKRVSESVSEYIEIAKQREAKKDNQSEQESEAESEAEQPKPVLQPTEVS